MILLVSLVSNLIFLNSFSHEQFLKEHIFIFRKADKIPTKKGAVSWASFLLVADDREKTN